ncbi:hypothetical protein KAI32_02785 [Candidatus Pacearchaeota archaeon]|nr:hypothetical protein [Candidatus Pacearchaeota archaeon]
MLNKRGTTQLAISKIITMVLLLIFLTLVGFSFSKEGLNLIEKIEGKIDEVLLWLEFGDSGGVEGDCVDYFVDVEDIGEGMVTRCKGSCSVKFEEGLFSGENFNMTGESLFIKRGSDGDKILDIIDNLPLAIKEREVNKFLMEDYEKYIGFLEDESFMSSGILSINILVKQDFLVSKFVRYFKLESGVWFEEKNNEWEEKKWDREIEGLNKVYSESENILNIDGSVLYRIGTPDDLIMGYRTEDGDIVSLEDIKAGEDSYKLLDIFNGNSKRIENDKDFKLFQDWFFSEKEKIKEHQDFLNNGLEEAEKLLLSESFGDFEGDPYNLFLDRASDGEGVFYFKTSSERYGLKGEELNLVKGEGDSGWKSTNYQILSLSDEEFEEKSNIHKVRKFLGGLRC